MPLITFESGPLSPEVKSKLIEKLTAISAEITGFPLQSFFIAIHELSDANIAIGGKTVKELKQKAEQ